MTRQHFQYSVGRVRASFMAVVILAMITGCSSGLSRVQTWEGTVDNADQVAVLAAPGAIKVREVNGQTMTEFLIDDLSLDYELLPGKNLVVFTYKTIWSKAERVDNGESKVHVVETPRQSITIDAVPGETYSFNIDKPENRREAEAKAKDFSVALVNSRGQPVARSSAWMASDSRRALARRAPVAGSSSGEVPSDVPPAAIMDQLKSLWGDASDEERREFLRWAFE